MWNVLRRHERNSENEKAEPSSHTGMTRKHGADGADSEAGVQGLKLSTRVAVTTFTRASARYKECQIVETKGRARVLRGFMTSDQTDADHNKGNPIIVNRCTNVTREGTRHSAARIVINSKNT
jgi:hypothetical protein